MSAAMESKGGVNVGAPVTDPRHAEMDDLAKRITGLCLSPEFTNLRRELEQLYRKDGSEWPVRQAFQDALYTLMVQEEIDRYKAKLLE